MVYTGPLRFAVQTGAQVGWPHPAAEKAENVPSELPAYTNPPATVGAPRTIPGASPTHSGWHVAWPQPSASNAYTPPNCEPTYTTPAATVGEESPMPTLARHIGEQFPRPQAATSNAYSLPRGLAVPTYRIPSTTAGVLKMAWGSWTVHTGSQDGPPQWSAKTSLPWSVPKYTNPSTTVGEDLNTRSSTKVGTFPIQDRLEVLDVCFPHPTLRPIEPPVGGGPMEAAASPPEPPRRRLPQPTAPRPARSP